MVSKKMQISFAVMATYLGWNKDNVLLAAQYLKGVPEGGTF